VCPEYPSSCHLTDLNRMTLQLDELIDWENRPDSGNMFCYSMLCAQYKMQQGTSLIKYVSCSNQFELTLNSLQ